MSNSNKMSQRAKLIVDRCHHDGQRLCKSFRVKATGDAEVMYVLEPSGKRVGPKGAQEVIDKGLLKPLDDGLFGGSTAQTWIA